MNQEWKYVKETNLNNIKLAEDSLNYKFADDFIEFILKYNGGIPKNNIFYLFDGSQKVFGKVLSFNKEDKENIYCTFESKYIDKLIAVANDPFGNLICFDRDTNNVVYWNHETDDYKYVSANWNNLINDLIDLDNIELEHIIEEVEESLKVLEKYKTIYNLEEIFSKYNQFKNYDKQNVESVLSSKYVLSYYIDEINSKADKELDEIILNKEQNIMNLDTLLRLSQIERAVLDDKKNKEYFKYKIGNIKKQLISTSNDIDKIVEQIDEKVLQLELEEVKEKISKSKYGYEYTLNGIDVLITKEELSDEIINYANKFVHFYRSNLERINDHVFEKLERVGWYVNDYSKEEILSGIGKPVLYVDDVNWASVSYIGNELDEHMITVEVANEFELGYVSVDG